jgi:uncharacterized protein
MLKGLHGRGGLQLFIGLLIGVAFGFLLQKGGVTRYDIIMGQLLLEDFTVIKVMFTAMVVGMVGVHVLKGRGLAELHPKPGSWGGTAVGGVIFGAGFALLGYCPGTLMGAIGEGALDALMGGLPGLILGAGLFSEWYPRLERTFLKKGYFGEITWPQLLRLAPWTIILPFSAGAVALLWWLERSGL